MAPRASRKPRMARHLDATPRATEQRVPIGDDCWQRQADAAAWAAISGQPPGQFLGWLEPIPTPPDLRARLREAGAAYQALPSRERLDRLMALAHEAAYGTAAPEPTPEPPRDAADGVSGGWWSDIPAKAENPPAAPPGRAEALAAFAEEAREALANVRDDPGNEGEAPVAREWWA